jgi:hypothetical protein
LDVSRQGPANPRHYAKDLLADPDRRCNVKARRERPAWVQPLQRQMTGQTWNALKNGGCELGKTVLAGIAIPLRERVV